MGFYRESSDRAPAPRRPGRALHAPACLLLAFALLALGSTAQPVSAARSGAAEARAGRQGLAPSQRGQYAIEFRSRYALSYGHTFIMYGRLNAKGELVERVVAGLHPAGDSSSPWMLGHFVPVASETGPSDGDLQDEYVSARYRVVVSEPEFRQIVAYIKQKQATSRTWHAIFNNCSGWVADVGAFMGLRSPNHLLMPANFINEMRRMNEGNDRSKARSLAAAQ